MICKYLRVKPGVGYVTLDSKIVGATSTCYGTDLKYSAREEGHFVYKRIGEFKKKPAVEIPVPFAVGQTVRNKKGDSVRIVCVDRAPGERPPTYPIVGLELSNNVEYPRTYQISGQYGAMLSEHDLIPLTQKSEEVVELVLDDQS